MNIKIIINFFLLVIFIGCKGQLKENDLKRENLKGEVLSIIEMEYYTEEKFGEIIKKDCHKKTEKFFNKEGDIEQEIVYQFNTIDQPFSSFSESILEYDGKGNIIEKKFTFNGFNSFVNVIKNVYDDSGNLLRYQKNDIKGNILEEISYEYDDKNNQTVQNVNKSDGSLESKYIYKYDNENNLIEISEYDSEEILLERCINKYDENNNYIEKRLYGYDGLLVDRVVYKYNELGFRETDISYSADGSIVSKKTYKYYSNGIEKERLEENYYVCTRASTSCEI